MALSFDFNANNKLYPFGSKSENELNTILISTNRDVYIALYPNNSNDIDFDDYNNKIIFGVSNILDYREAYISSNENKIIRFNDYNIITNVDFIPYGYSNESIGDNDNRYNNLYIKDNINISNSYIRSEQSNIYFNDLLVNNLNILNNLITSLLYTSNVYIYKLTCLNNVIGKNNIINSNLIICDILYTSNIHSYGNIYGEKLNNLKNIYTNNLIASNVIVEGLTNVSNIINNYIYTSNIITSNLINYNNITTQNLYVSNYINLDKYTINGDIIPYNIYNIGNNNNNKWKKVYINAIYSDLNIISTKDKNLIINNNLITDNIYSKNTISTTIGIIKDLNAYDSIIISKDIFNIELLKTNDIYTSNLISLNDIISKNISTNKIYANTIFTSNINILNITSTSNINIDEIINNDSYIVDLTSFKIKTDKFVANNISYIKNIVLNSNILTKTDNINDIGDELFNWKSIYISGNINIGENIIRSINISDINITNGVNVSNIYTSNIKTSNIIANNIIADKSIINSYKLNVKSLITDSIISSNVLILGDVNVSNIYNDFDVYTSNLFLSNIEVKGELYNKGLKTVVNILYSSNDVYSNVLNKNYMNAQYVNISNITKLNKINLKTDLIPSEDSIYSLGSINKKWKELYLSGNTIYLGNNIISISDTTKFLNIFNNNYELDTIITKKINIKNEGSITYEDNGQLKFGSDNNSSLDYYIISNIPILSNNNYLDIPYNLIINGLRENSNTIIYGNVSINGINGINDILNVNGKILSDEIHGGMIGHSELSNINATNIINQLPSIYGGLNLKYILSNITFNNKDELIIKDGISSYNGVEKAVYYIGDASNISNIMVDNIVNNLSISDYGTGVTNFYKNCILIGNDINGIYNDSKLRWGNCNLIIDGSINATNIKVDKLIYKKDYLNGNGVNISNIISSNINGKISKSQGGINIIDDITFTDNKILKINNKLYASNIQSKYYGDGVNISNIYSSNIINKFNIYTNPFNNINLNWNNNTNILTVNKIYGNRITTSVYTGDGNNISNINKFSNKLNIIKGGTNKSTLNINELLYYDGDITSTNKLYYLNNKLNVIGDVYGNIIQGGYEGDGINISNIDAKNITRNILIKSGGTNNNNTIINSILYKDNDLLTTTNKLSFINNNLIIKGGLIVSCNIQSKYYGNGINISNIQTSNIYNIIKTTRGGTGVGSFSKNKIIFGGGTTEGYNNIITDNDLIYENDILNIRNITGKIINVSDYIFSYETQGGYIGDGNNISNTRITNFVNKLLISKGGTGLDIINKNRIVLYPNIKYENNILTINSNIYANRYDIGYNIGDGNNISNIITSNIINRLKGENGGLINYIDGNNITWELNNLKIKGTVYGNKIIGSNLIGDGINISNINASNLILYLKSGIISNNIYFEKDINWFEDRIIINSNLYGDKILSSIYNGDGYNISNIKLKDGIINVINGGLNIDINSINNIIYGNGNSTSYTNKLKYDSNNIIIDGNIYAKIIQGKYIGDGINISNIISSNIKGIISGYGGLYTPLSYKTYSNLSWNNKNLRIKGKTISRDVRANKLYGDGYNISNILTSNFTKDLLIENGGFNNLQFNSSNIYWSNDILYIDGKVISKVIQGEFIGSGRNISNINLNNIPTVLTELKGGLDTININKHHILFDNRISEELLWSNNTLYVKGNIISKDIQSYLNGDGNNISNIVFSNIIDRISVKNGGTGCNIIEYGKIIVGNDDKPVLTPNIIWINNKLNTENIYGSNIYGKFIGDGKNISNIYTSNIRGLVNYNNGGIINTIYIPYGQQDGIGNIKSNRLFRYDNNILYTPKISVNNINSSNIKNVRSIISKNIQGTLIGDGRLIKNIYTSNFNDIILKSGRGTGYNNIPEGVIINNNISQDLIWSNKTINTKKIISKRINTRYYYGDGYGISNISAKIVINELDVRYGGLNCNEIPIYNLIIGNEDNIIITNSNIKYHNDTLYINSEVHSSNYIGNFYSTSYNDYSNTINNLNIYASNIIGHILYNQGGLTSNRDINGMIYFSSNDNIITNDKLKWENSIFKVKGNIIGDKLNSLYSNIIGEIEVIKGGLGDINEKDCILIGNDDNSIYTTPSLIWKSNVLITENIVSSKKIIGSLKGDGNNISNILATNLYNFLGVNNGGIGSLILNKGTILTGNNNYLGNNSINWRNNVLTVLGEVKTNIEPIQSAFIGDGRLLTNIDISQNTQLNDMRNGCTDRSYIESGNILYGNNRFNIKDSVLFKWDDNDKKLVINNGYIDTNRLKAEVLYNFVASNVIGELATSNGGTGLKSIPQNYLVVGNDNNTVIVTSNLTWDNKNRLNIRGILSVIGGNALKGQLYGDARGITNIEGSNIIGIIATSNGGLGNNYFDKYNILVGDGKNRVLTTNNFRYDSNFTISKIITKNIAGSYLYGNGYNISNYNAETMMGSIDIKYGGLGCNIIPINRILIGGIDSNNILTTDNVYWSNNNNTLNIIGETKIKDKVINNIYIGDGTNVSNIQYSNIVNEINVINGGTLSNYLLENTLLIGNNDRIITTSNVIWNGSLNITSNIIVNEIKSNRLYTTKLQGKFIGESLISSNYIDSNFIHNASVINGGTGYNYIEEGYILVGNNSDTLLKTSNLKYKNNEMYSKNIVISKELFTKKIYGDGQNISNYKFYVSNMMVNDIINIINGCMGSNIHNSNEILFGNRRDPIISTSNLRWVEGNLYINEILSCTNLYISGGITGISYQGSFYGDGIGLSNIISSNLIDAIQVKNQGTGYSNIIPNGQLLIGNNTAQIITTPDLLYDSVNTRLNINGIFNATTISITNGIQSSNNISSNIIVANKSTYNGKLYGDQIFTSNIIGDGCGLSNIYLSNINNITLSVINGGLGCNIIPNSHILIGDGNKIYETNKLKWIESKLIVNDNIDVNNVIASNIYNRNTFASNLIGDGYNISNISLKNIIGVLDVKYGGTGCNYIVPGHIIVGNNSNTIITTSNLYWVDDKLQMYVNGDMNIITVSTTNASFNKILTSNLLINNGNMNNSNLISETIQGKFIGGGINLSNVLVSNLTKVSLSIDLGGFQSNNIKEGYIIIGNDINPIGIKDELTYINNNFKVLGQIVNKNINVSKYTLAQKIYVADKLYGDGKNISNIYIKNLIGVLDVKYGGTGCNYIDKGLILVGNNDNGILATSNLYRNIGTNELFVNSNIIATTLSSTIINTSNIYINNTYDTNKCINNIVYSKYIQGKYIGDGINISNIFIDNFSNLLISINKGGTNSNTLDRGCILIGNNDKPFLLTSNLMYRDNKLTVNDNIILNNLNANKIYTNKIQGTYIGDGSSLSNINVSNLTNVLLNTNNGGTGYRTINRNSIIYGDINGNITYSSNLLWNNTNGQMYINSNISTKTFSGTYIRSTNLISCNLNTVNYSYCSNVYANIIRTSKYYGDGTNISNISINSIHNTIRVNNGGITCNIIPSGYILIGNDDNSINSTCNIIWNDNKLHIAGIINTQNINNIGDVISKNIYTYNYYGDGINISNIYTNNIKGVFPTTISGFGISNIPKGRLIVGDGINNVITTENLIWQTTTNSLIINGLFSTNTTLSTTLLNCSNIETLNLYVNGNGNISNIITNTIQGGYIGDGSLISNINITGVLSNIIGGTSCNIIPKGYVLIGNNDNIYAHTDLNWNNGILEVKGDIKTSNIINNNIIISKDIFTLNLIGDGGAISNIQMNKFKGEFIVRNGGTGSNYIENGRLLIGNGDNSGIFTTQKLYYSANKLYIDGELKGLINLLNNNNIITSNLVSSNIINNSKTNFKNVYSDNIQGGNIGDGKNISNLIINNFNNILQVSKGGTGNSYLLGGTILIGNDVNPIINTSNILLNESNLIINGKVKINNLNTNIIKANNIYSLGVSGDGTNISNININNIVGAFTPNMGGLGLNNIERGYILIGNDVNKVNASSNLYWDITNSILNINDRIETVTISSALYNISNYTTCNINVNGKANFNRLYSELIQSKYLGSGIGISNIILSSLIRSGKELYSITSNYINYGNIIIGGGKNNIIETSNFAWYDDKLNVNNIQTSNLINIGNYINNNILNTQNIYINNNIKINRPFYISLYLASDQSINNFIPFNVDNTISSDNIDESIWNINHFIAPNKGIYSIDYTILTTSPTYIWINKGNIITNNYNNRHGLRYILEGGTIQQTIYTDINESWYFAIDGMRTILKNNSYYGNTKASIVLLQNII